MRSDLIDPAIDAHHGRIVKRTGDGSLIEFRSVVDAVRCAIEVQSALDRNLASAGTPIGFHKILIGRAEETRLTIGEVLRLSPRDTTAYISLTHEGLARNHLGSWEQAVAWCRRAIEANRNYPRAYFQLALALAHLDRLAEAHSASRAGIAINPSFIVSRARVNWRALSDGPTHLAQLEPIFDGLRKAGVPEQ